MVSRSFFFRSDVVLSAFAIMLFALGAFLMMRPPPPAIADIGSCIKKESETDRLMCARETIRVLLKEKPAHEIMREVEKTYPYDCHPIGHVIGQEAYKMLRSTEAAFAACSPQACVHACTHGVVGEVFLSTPGIVGSEEEWRHPNIELITLQAKRLCSDKTTCHAVGHVLFLIVEDLTQALRMCDDIAGDNAITCHSGVFMENAGKTLGRTLEENRVDESEFRDKEDLLSPCNSVSPRYQRPCFRFLFISQPAYLRDHGILDVNEMFKKITDACDSVSQFVNRRACFRSAGWALQGMRLPFSQAYTMCLGFLQYPDQGACLFGVSDSFTDQGVSIDEIYNTCEKAPDKQAMYNCYHGTFTALSDRIDAFEENVCTDSFPSCAEALDVFLADPQFHDFI